MAAEPNLSSSGGSGEALRLRDASCEECSAQPWKYRCPGCSILTCSLGCVQSHKRRLGCTGKRPRAAPVALDAFDDQTLLSDYNFLEETSRVRESAQRLIEGHSRNSHPQQRYYLKKNAEYRGTKLFLLPPGSSKCKQNLSKFIKSGGYIKWTIEWRFRAIDSAIVDNSVSELLPLRSLLSKHLSPTPWKDKFTPYRNVPLEDLKLFVQKCAKDSKSSYRLLAIDKPLKTLLRDILIVEFPVIHVYLPEEQCKFKIQKPKEKKVKMEKPKIYYAANSPVVNGVVFAEEEFEEGELSPRTVVIDLLDDKLQRAGFTQGDVSTNSSIETNLLMSPEALCSKDLRPCCSNRDQTDIPAGADNTSAAGSHGSTALQKGGTVFDKETIQGRNVDRNGGFYSQELNWLPRDGMDLTGFLMNDDLNFSQDEYMDLIGDMDPAEFLSLDFKAMADDIINGTYGLGTNQSSRTEEMEEGEIPSS